MDIDNRYIQENDLITFSDLEQPIQDFCDKYNIPDLSKDSQNRWNALLMYLYQAVFKNRKYTYQNPKTRIYIIDICNIYCDLYIYLCNTYNKIINIYGYTMLLGIDDNTIYDWKNKNNCTYNEQAVGAVSCKPADIYKKLVISNEQSLSDALSSGRAPVGIIAILNKKHGWSDNRQTILDNTDKPIIARKDVLQLPNNQNQDTNGIL